jgi:hypothetical protein
MPPARRFTLIDAMVLMAATAVGLGLAKEYSQDLLYFLQGNRVSPRPWESWPGILVSTALRGMAVTLPCGMAWTLGVLALRLRQPRPAWRRLARQPGLVACLVAPIPVALALVGRAVYHFLETYTNLLTPARLPSPPFITHGLPGLPDGFPTFWPGIFLSAPMFIVPQIGLAVALAWIVLAMSGRCRPEPSWIDRLGRALGASWIVAAVLLRLLSELATYLQ